MRLNAFWDGLVESYRRTKMQTVAVFYNPVSGIRDCWLNQVKNHSGRRLRLDTAADQAVLYVIGVDREAYSSTVQAIEAVGVPSHNWSWLTPTGHIISNDVRRWGEKLLEDK